MAAFVIPESSENALYEADRALAALETVFASLGEAQLECRCDELAALLGLIREKVASARETARFDARAG